MTLLTLKNLIREVLAESKYPALQPKYANKPSNVAAKAIEALMRKNGYKKVGAHYDQELDGGHDGTRTEAWVFSVSPLGFFVNVKCAGGPNDLEITVTKGENSAGPRSTRHVTSISEAEPIIKNPGIVFGDADNDPLQGGTVVQVMDHGKNGKEIVIQTKGGAYERRIVKDIGQRY